jgi:hypothetical protein
VPDGPDGANLYTCRGCYVAENLAGLAMG